MTFINGKGAVRWKGINCSATVYPFPPLRINFQEGAVWYSRINFQLLRLNPVSFAYREPKLAHSCCQHSNLKTDFKLKICLFCIGYTEIISKSVFKPSKLFKFIIILRFLKKYTGIIHIVSIQADVCSYILEL